MCSTINHLDTRSTICFRKYTFLVINTTSPIFYIAFLFKFRKNVCKNIPAFAWSMGVQKILNVFISVLKEVQIKKNNTQVLLTIE